MVRAVARSRGQGLFRAVVAVLLASRAVGGAGARGPVIAPRAPAPIVRVLALDAGNFLLDESSGRIITVAGQGKRHTLVALDVRTGRQVRSVPLPPDNFPFLVGIDRPERQFVLGIGAARVEVRDLDTLRLRRTIDLPLGRDAVWLTALDGVTGHLFVIAYNPKSNLLRTSLLLAPLFVIDTRRGVVLYTRMLDGTPTEMEVDEHAGRLYLIGQGHGTTLDVLDARTGRSLRSFPLGGQADNPQIGPSLVLDRRRERAFVLADEGAVVTLDDRSGRVVRTTQTEGTNGIVADAPAGLVFTRAEGTGLGDGTINVLDARSGALRRTIGTKLLPLGGPAVDARTGRAFIFLYRRVTIQRTSCACPMPSHYILCFVGLVTTDVAHKEAHGATKGVAKPLDVVVTRKIAYKMYAG